MLINERFIDPILGAARIDELKGKAYSIGPFGIRVGFAYQQERALNLVAALVQRGHVKKGHRVLIAGGGLAGLTAMLALRGLGIGDVFLCESRDSVLKSQLDASHRKLHPCYNNWPMKDYCSPASNLPFLNWYASDAARVVSFLGRRWTQLYSKKLPATHCGRELISLEPSSVSKGSRGGIIAKIRNKTDGSEESSEFDLAILATGFGVEKDLGVFETSSYWTSDRINVLREDEADRRNLFVSGIGDGGLMDFIRFGFQQDPDYDLAIATMSYLRHAKYQMPRQSLEQSDHALSPIEHCIRQVEEEAKDLIPETAEGPSTWGSPLENEIARLLYNGYKKAIAMLPGEAVDFLDERLHERVLASNRLHLVGKLEHPFTCATAPINKFLVAYLLAKSERFYTRGYVDTQNRKLVTKQGNESSLEGHVVILRHGAQPPVFELSESFAKQCRALNRTLANFVDVERIDARLTFDLQDIVSQDPRNQIYAAYRTPLAQAFASNEFKGRISARKGRGHNEEPFWFEFEATGISDVAETSRRLGGFPHEIFGVKLVAAPVQDAQSGLGKRR